MEDVNADLVGWELDIRDAGGHATRYRVRGTCPVLRSNYVLLDRADGHGPPMVQNAGAVRRAKQIDEANDGA